MLFEFHRSDSQPENSAGNILKVLHEIAAFSA